MGFGPHDVFQPWDVLQFGDDWNGVVLVQVVHSDGTIQATTCERPCKPILFRGISNLQIGSSIVILGAKVVQVQPQLVCEVGSSTMAYPVPCCTQSQLQCVVEFCCGAGFFSKMAGEVGLVDRFGVDLNKRWAEMYSSLHPNAAFVHGSCGDTEVVRALLGKHCVHPIVVAGIACQPHSRAGDQRGMQDVRGSSLPETLRSGWLLRAPIIVLECVPEIQSNADVQAILAHFAHATGCHVTQQILKLSASWCARRDRWFAIITSQALGPLHIPPMPDDPDHQQVCQVMPSIRMWPKSDIEQLQLSLYELSTFRAHASGGMDALMLNMKSTLPTCLHSAGNHLYPCRCGCRPGLSYERICSKGLFCTLIGLNQCVRHCDENMELCRYLHPEEVLLMHGGLLPVSWGPDLRLALAALGQSVAPLQGLWILTHVQGCLQTFLGLPVIDPHGTFAAYVHRVLTQRDVYWPKKQVGSTTSSVMPRVVKVQDHVQGSSFEFAISQPATVQQFVQAEEHLAKFMEVGDSLHPTVIDMDLSDGDGVALDLHAPLAPHDHLVVGCPSMPEFHDIPDCPCGDWPIEEMPPSGPQFVPEVSPTVPFTIESTTQSAAFLLQCKVQELLDFKCPEVCTEQQIEAHVQTLMPAIERRKLLANQLDLWADDEIRFHLQRLAEQGPSEQALQVWDPLLLGTVTATGHPRAVSTLHTLVAHLEPNASVLSAVLVDKHWYPLMWRFEAGKVWGFTCGHSFGFSVALNKLHTLICDARQVDRTALRFHTLGFHVPSCCGAMAISFLEHLVMSTELPKDMPALREVHSGLRKAFLGFCIHETSRPWIWGRGDASCTNQLADLLKSHGVPGDVAPTRAKQVLEALGESEVSRSLASTNPWKDLKWLASQRTPMFQLVRPVELQDVIDKRIREGKPFGNRAQKKGKGKGKEGPTPPRLVDPHVLRLEQGVFEWGKGEALCQLQMSQIGPNACGVVLCTLSEAEPFLRDGKQVSLGGLALVIVDSVGTRPNTSLIAELVRLPALCISNAEPVLVDGLLYQLGAHPVTRKTTQEKFELVSISSCVAKLMVFRDQTEEPWEQVTAHPMKHLFQKIPVLQACKDDSCAGNCEQWHPAEECNLKEPLLEVWGRQWMLHSFASAQPPKADVFSVHVRLPSCLQQQLQTYSGIGGIFIEPKEVDGKQPSASFQVLWMPKASFREITHLRQTVSGICGIARLGLKFGVRCATAQAERVHQAIKPGGSYLPQGKKLSFLIGPLPFGTLKTCVTALVESIGWAARPLQPVAAAGHVGGVMWRVQAVEPPAKSILATDQGEVVITRVVEPALPEVSRPAIVATSQTASLVTAKGKALDPLQLYDPWASGLPKAIAPQTSVAANSSSVEALQQQVVDEVLSRLPKPSMEVDEDQGTSSRLATLEAQVLELKNGHQHLHNVVSEQGQVQQTQISTLQQQQGRIEGAVNENAVQLRTFQSQFKAQLDLQQGQLDNLFQQQMDKIESLFQKKARTA